MNKLFCFLEEELFSRAKDDDRSKLEKEVSKVWKPLLLLVPVRLGLDSFNQAYLEHLKVSYNIYIKLIKIVYSSMFCF